MLNDFPVYQHELAELFLYYNTSEAALTIGRRQLRGLLRLEKKSGVEIMSDVDYSTGRLFDFSSWKQWNPLHNKFDEDGINSVMKLTCVDENFGFCTSGILHPDVSSVGSFVLNVLMPGDKEVYTILDIRRIYFKLRLAGFHNVRPVYELMSDIDMIPYYLYHQSGKWRVGSEIGLQSARSGIILEMTSNVMRIEYERESEWYAIDRGARDISALRYLRCSRQSAADINCRTAATDSCHNGGSCHVDARTGNSTCICTPDFRGIRCQIPVAKCTQPPPSDTPSFAFSDRLGSIMTTFCPDRVRFSVCDGIQWWPYGCQALLDTSSALPVNASSVLPEFIGKDPPAVIALVIACLVGVQLVLPFFCYCCISCCKFDENKLNIEEMHPPRERLTNFLRACSGFFYLSWWAWFAYIIYYLCMWHMHVALDGTTIWSAVAIMAIICIFLLYIVVLCESICSHEYEYLTKLRDITLAEEQIARMKLQSPTIKFKAECWHSETRTRTV